MRLHNGGCWYRRGGVDHDVDSFQLRLARGFNKFLSGVLRASHDSLAWSPEHLLHTDMLYWLDA